jgi:Na+/melibiose symporter-like transporter
VALVSSSILAGLFDAALPVHLKRDFGFNSAATGGMFAARCVPEIILAPFAGWIVNRHGTKVGAVIGLIPLCPALFLLSAPKGPAIPSQIGMLISILFLNGFVDLILLLTIVARPPCSVLPQ